MTPPRRHRLRESLLAAVLTLVAALLFIALPFWWYGESPATAALTSGDGTVFFFPAHYYLRAVLAAGELPLWNPYLYGGFPLAADPQWAVWFPPAWLALVPPPTLGWNLRLVLWLWMAFGGAWFLARRMGLSVAGAMVVVLSFGLGGSMLVRLPIQPPMVATAAMLPWMAGLLYGRLRPGRLAAGVGITGGLCLLAGHPQVALYVLASFGLLAVCRLAGLWWRGLMGGRAVVVRLGALAAGAVLAAMVAAIQLVPTAELGRQSLRAEITEDFFFSYSFPPVGGAPLAFLPFVYGDYKHLDWPDFWYVGPWNMNELACHPGQLALGGAAVALGWMLLGGWAPGGRWIRRRGWPWAVVALVAVAAAMGGATPLGDLLRQLPGFGRFRALARFLMVAQLAVPVLAALVLEAIVRTRRREPLARWVAPVLVVPWFVGLCVALALAGGMGASPLAPVFKEFGLEVGRHRLAALARLHPGIWPMGLLALGAAAVLAVVAWRWPRGIGAVAVVWLAVEMVPNGLNTMPRPENVLARAATEFRAPLLESPGLAAVAISTDRTWNHLYEFAIPGLNMLVDQPMLTGIAPLAPERLVLRHGPTVVGSVEPPALLARSQPGRLHALGLRRLVAERAAMPELPLRPTGEPVAVQWLTSATLAAAASNEGEALVGADGKLLVLRAEDRELAQAEAPMPRHPTARFMMLRLRLAAVLPGREGLPLHVDLFAPGWDSPLRELQVPDTALSEVPAEFTALWAVPSAPADARLRFFTRSPAGIVVHDAKVEWHEAPFALGAWQHTGFDHEGWEAWDLVPGPDDAPKPTRGGRVVEVPLVDGANNRIRTGNVAATDEPTEWALGRRYHKGWYAELQTADGTIALDVFCGEDDDLRAMAPAGGSAAGKLLVSYRPSSFVLGTLLTIVGLAAVGGMVATPLFRIAMARLRRRV